MGERRRRDRAARADRRALGGSPAILVAPSLAALLGVVAVALLACGVRGGGLAALGAAVLVGLAGRHRAR